jgi:hypothetical protein
MQNATVVAIKHHPFSGANDEQKKHQEGEMTIFCPSGCLPRRQGRKQDTYVIPRGAKENIIIGNKFDELSTEIMPSMHSISVCWTYICRMCNALMIRKLVFV